MVFMVARWRQKMKWLKDCGQGPLRGQGNVKETNEGIKKKGQ